MAQGVGEVAAEERTRRWARGPLRPFAGRQYRFLAGAIFFDLFAAGCWLIATVWLVIRELDGGPGTLSLVSTGAAVGLVASVLVGGVVADRVPQRRIMLVTTFGRVAVIASVVIAAETGGLTLWHLTLATTLMGIAEGFYIPAYSAMLPSIVEADDLLAANAVEGFLRPTIMQAAGPAVAGAAVAAWSAPHATAIILGLQVGTLLMLWRLRPVPLRRPEPADASSAVADLVAGFQYMVRTTWFLATLLFACLMVLVVIGPIEVLIPFVITERAGGGPEQHALVLAAFGIGGAIAALIAGFFPLPRRYLSVMMGAWTVAAVPMIAVGFTDSVAVIAAAMFLVGALFSWPTVIWGTLLQRRVPPEMLGRASSLDFFVSLLLMPVSMALAGPVSALVGLGATFVVAGVIPVVVGLLTIVVARMPRDEVAHPLS